MRLLFLAKKFFKKLLAGDKQNRRNTNHILFLLSIKRLKSSIGSVVTQNKTLQYIFTWISIAVLFCLFLIPNAIAHSPEQSYLYFKIYDRAIETRVEITVKDLNQALGLDLPGKRKAKAEDIAPHLDLIKEYIDDKLTLSQNGQPYTLEYQKYDLFKTGFAQFVTFDYRIANLVEVPDKFEVYYGVLLDIEPKHKNLVVIEHNWKTGTFQNESGVSLIFTPNSKPQTLDISSASMWRGFLAVVNLGVLHIWEGIDHILFLVALILPAVLRRETSGWQPVPKFRPAFIQIIKIATAFTVAHSITLALATLQIVEIPSRLVESLIAVSIAVAAIDIIYPIFKEKIWLIIFGFGLFHGFGFANVLAELGIVREHALLSLFGFNLGVELGQIVIIAIVFPILYLLRKQKVYTKFILKYSTYFLLLIAFYWLTERSLDINLATSAKQLVKSVLL